MGCQEHYVFSSVRVTLFFETPLKASLAGLAQWHNVLRASDA